MFEVVGIRQSKDYLVTVGAGEEVALNVAGEFYSVISTDQTSFEISVDGGATAFAKRGTKRRMPAGSEFKVVRVKNPNGSSLTARLEIGYGDFIDGEISVGGDVVVGGGDTLTDYTDQTLSATATALVLAANADRTEAWISNLSGSVTLRWGTSAAAAARGIPVTPGQTMIVSSKAAIYLHNPDAGTVDVAKLEISN